MTTVEGFEQNMSQFLHCCLGLSKILSSIAFHGHTNKLQPYFTGLTEEFKVTRITEGDTL